MGARKDPTQIPQAKKLKSSTGFRLTPLFSTGAVEAFFLKLKSYSSDDWARVGRRHIVRLFTDISQNVPAYQAFLREQKVNPASLRGSRGVATVPPVTKKNYLHIHSFTDLFRSGTLRLPQVLTSTSGSTGRPTFFARSHKVDDHSSFIHELIYRTGSLDPRASTLVVVCFGMGVWIGGVITYQAFERMGRRGYPISVITPGINKHEILKILTDLAPQYEQLVLAGYPPFLKDVIDDAVASGIDFHSRPTQLLFAAEAFTEGFRDYLGNTVGVKNILTDAVNIYGSADIGTMAFETPIAILARRLAMRQPKLFEELFKGTEKTPTLAQFVPDFVNFEAPNGDIMISGDSAIPLFRYAIGDRGGVYTFTQLTDLFSEHGVDLLREVKREGISAYTQQLPFVYVYERADLSTTLYGLQIYPETIKEVLLQPRYRQHFTGKLTLLTRYDSGHNQYLEVNVECRPVKSPNVELVRHLLTSIVQNLHKKNSEFRELSSHLGGRAEPKIVLWPYEDPKYFRPGIKQRWAIPESSATA